MAGIGAVVLAVQPADSKAKNYLRTLPVVGMYATRFFPTPTPAPVVKPDVSEELAEATVASVETPVPTP